MAMNIESAFNNHLELIRSLAKDSQIQDGLIKAVNLIIQAYKLGNKVLLCGNGGSAADAEHIAAELSGKFKLNRKPLDAEALHVNGAALTAISNDYSYEDVFQRMIEAKAKKGDVTIFISTSGTSSNVINGLKTARQNQCITISFCGSNSKAMSAYSDLVFSIQSEETARIQEAYMLLLHIICEHVEWQLFGA